MSQTTQTTKFCKKCNEKLWASYDIESGYCLGCIWSVMDERRKQDIEYIKNSVRGNVKVEIGNSSYEKRNMYTIYGYRYTDVSKLCEKFIIHEVGQGLDGYWITVESKEYL